jgi:hypothetical protein
VENVQVVKKKIERSLLAKVRYFCIFVLDLELLHLI